MRSQPLAQRICCYSAEKNGSGTAYRLLKTVFIKGTVSRSTRYKEIEDILSQGSF
jgi:hypothetical protein